MIISVDSLFDSAILGTYNEVHQANNTYLNRNNIMYTEITRNIFNMIVSIDVKCSKVVNQEHGSKAYFIVDNVTLLKVDNYLNCTSQYYIQDINA